MPFTPSPPPLPGTYLVRVDLVRRLDFLDRFVPRSASKATFALNSPLKRGRALIACPSFSRWNPH